MKKNDARDNYTLTKHKVIRIMKLSTLFIFCLVFSLSATVYAQKKKISINERNTTILNVLKTIENNSEFVFFFNDNQIDVTQQIDINVKDATLAEILNQLLTPANYNYKIIDRQVLITKAKTKEAGLIAQQNQKKITGTIVDSKGIPIIGANVVEEGTTNGTITDLDGKFILTLKKGANLLISYIGYSEQKIATAGKSSLQIILKEDSELLDEVVVVGYGTLDKKEVTSSISSIKNKDFISGELASPLQAIKGKVSNLSVINTNGADPNSGVSLQLRGANSINAGQGPLVVVDGIAGGNINDIQKEDIVSIDVLKDASAAAIYGTRGSGGVVLITTKQAMSGKTKVSYTTDLTIETLRKKANVLSVDEFLEHQLGEDRGSRTNWFDEVTNNTPFTHRHVITFQGGSENLKNYTSLYYKDANGMALQSGRKEIGGRTTMNYAILDGRLNFTGRLSYADIIANNASNGIFKMALKLNPTIPVYDVENTTGYNVLLGGWEEYNPVADVMLKTNQSHNKNLMTSLTTMFKITKDLNTSLNLGVKSNSERYVYWESSEHKSSKDSGKRGYAKMENKQWTDLSLDWLFNYNKQFKKHTIKAVGGYSFQRSNADGFYASNADFPVDGVKWWDLSTGSYLSDGRASMDSWKNPQEELVAFLGRVNYNYDDKYMATLSARYEGISKLSPGNQWGLFPSLSVGWRISKESFMQDIDWLSDLKVRFGYGITGNANFGSGVGTRMYSPDTWWLSQGRWFRTYGLAHNVNPDLKWEKKTEYNYGLDFSLFNHRLSGKIDVYKRDVDDLIYSISVSQPPAVHDKTTMNTGCLQNKGFEVELTGIVINNKNWNYTTTVKASHNTTTLKSLWGSQTYWDRKSFEAPGSPGSAVRLVAGEDIGRFYIWKFAGFDDDGNWLLYDKNNEVIPANKKSQDDKRFTGNAIPKVILAWENTIRYKDFDMSLFFRSWIGHDVYNKINMYYGLPNVTNQNVLKDAFQKNKDIRGEKELCDFWLEKGTFVKLDALTMGYTFKIPAIQKYVRNVRASLTARDLFCITGYSGLDPEVNTNGLDPGFEEQNVYPQVRSFTLGLNFNF